MCDDPVRILATNGSVDAALLRVLLLALALLSWLVAAGGMKNPAPSPVLVQMWVQALWVRSLSMPFPDIAVKAGTTGARAIDAQSRWTGAEIGVIIAIDIAIDPVHRPRALG
jgi:hypothetical protein